MSIAVDVRELSRNYGNIQALNAISFQVEPGRRFGLIGPDGAGKTTLIRILCGLIMPDSGRFSMLGIDGENRRAIKTKIGYMPQRFSLYPDLTVRENMQFFADLFGVAGAIRREREARLLKFSRLDAFARRKARDLSGGMKQKLALSCALIHTPPLLILDEPTTGVDPLSRREFWDIITDLSEHENTTVIISTPYMDEATRCHDVAFFHHGKILGKNTPDGFVGQYPYHILEVVGENLHDLPIPEIPDIHGTRRLGDRLRLAVTSPDTVRKALAHALHSRPRPPVIAAAAPTLEDVFVHFLETFHDRQ